MLTIESIETDLKAEVLGAVFLTTNANPARLFIERLGTNARSHTKDVVRIYEDVAQYTLQPQLVIQSFRQSIYEAIPENVFHPPTLGGIGKSSDEIVAEIRLQRQKEAEARIFFSPFEQEAAYLEMLMLATELMYEQKVRFDGFFQLFERAWPMLRRLPHATGLAFIYLVPVLHRMRGDRALTERCFAYILGFPVFIREVYGDIAIPEAQGSLTIGKASLGLSSNLGGRQYDGIASWKLEVGPVPFESTASVLPHTDFYSLLLLLSDYFIPAGRFVDYVIKTEKEQATRLGGNNSGARLDYTFFI